MERERCRCTCAVRRRMCVACGIRLLAMRRIEQQHCVQIRPALPEDYQLHISTHSRSHSHTHTVIRHIGFVSSAALQVLDFDLCFASVSFLTSPSPSFVFACACFCTVCAGISKCVMSFFFFPVYSTKINSVKAFTTHSRKPAPKKPVCIPA